MEAYDFTPERKSLYTDLDALGAYGFCIESDGKRPPRYHYVPDPDKELTLNELKLISDCVRSSKFMSSAMSNNYVEPPQQIYIRLNSVNQPELIWENNPNASSYKIYRLGSSGEYGMIGEIPAVKFESIKSFVDVNPKLGEDNFYCIRACRKSSSSASSDSVKIFVP